MFLRVLFSIFLNDLEDHLRADKDEGISFEYLNGTTLDLIKLFVLPYADDTVILGETVEDLQKSIDSFLRYCALRKVKVNESKTNVFIFGARKTDSFAFHLGNTPLEVVNNYRYLGTYFSKNRSFLQARKYIAKQAMKVSLYSKSRLYAFPKQSYIVFIIIMYFLKIHNVYSTLIQY